MTSDTTIPLLAETARRFTDERFPFEELRTRRDAGARRDAIRSTWSELGSLGWAGMLVPEALGGTQATWSDVGVVLDALGASLAVTPMVTAGVVAALLLGGEALGDEHVVRSLATGDACVVLAHTESAHFAAGRLETTAAATDDGYVLHGAKRHVVLGPVADGFLVTARTDPDDAVGVFLVDAHAAGVSAVEGMLIDGQPVATLALDGVRVGRTALVASGAEQLADALLAGTIATAAMMAGGMRRALELTVGYLCEREQFGVPIGAFQALQHRVARLHCQAMLAESLVQRALHALDAHEPAAPRRVHAAKAYVSDTYLRVAEEGVQMHGGIGMTDEIEIGYHLAAARVAELEFGAASFHRRRYAEISGY